jgi:hypothetical protein
LGVGKLIGGDLYLHRDYTGRLPDQDAYRAAAAAVPDGFDFNVVKAARDGGFTFFRSPDFDSADEPTAGDYVRVGPDGKVRLGATRNLWHHKWLWVTDTYGGFDVAASRERSRAWLALEGVASSRIGNPDYWRTHVVPRIP